mmetsp:Transcript_65862/g.132285  ORF Transcript_65862/g.132285 Transcript_65862/m.132285 type:complete len:270 (-) Transcript_65862:783-1592(-)
MEGMGTPRCRSTSASTQLSVLGQLLHLVVEPMAGLRRARLARPRAQRVGGGAIPVEAWAEAARGQLLGATVGLAGGLEPEVGVDDPRRRGSRRGGHARTRAADVAPVLAGRAHGGLAVPARVDDHVRLHAQDRAGRHRQLLCIVELVVPRAPVPRQAARVGATDLLSVPAVEAVAVAVAGVGLVWAERPQRLVVGHVGCEAPHLAHGQVHPFQHPHEVHEVVLPTEPAAVGRIQIDGDLRRLRGELLDGVLDAILVGLPGGGAAAARVV